jgi:polyhydroxyalkanoate synthesis regulator phasin
MDDQRARKVNEAAEKFAEAIKESYQALADRSVSAQELNAQLTQDFFNGVINNLRTQAESNRALAEDLIEQQRKQQEASQALTQESVDAYMDFLGSMFAFPRQSPQPAGRAGREAGGAPPQASPREEPPPGEERPGRRGRRSPPARREEPPPGEERPGTRTP